MFGGIKILRHQIVERHNFVLIKLLEIFVYYEEVDRCCTGLSTILSWCCLLEGCDDFLNVIKNCDLDSTTYPVVQSNSQINVYISSTYRHLSFYIFKNTFALLAKPFDHEIIGLILAVNQLAVIHVKIYCHLRSHSDCVEDAGVAQILLEPYFLQALG